MIGSSVGTATATIRIAARPQNLWDHMAHHWREYAIEGALLGLFMLSACGFTVLLFHPDGAGARAFPGEFSRLALMGVAMGVTAALLIYSPLGQRSGAHMNPSATLTFLRLGRIARVDAGFYILSQFLGGVAGVALARLIWGAKLSHAAVNYAVTVPGRQGTWIALGAEMAISFLLMFTVLAVSNSRLARFTGGFVALLVGCYITFEAPVSGMSLNPARTVASAMMANVWSSVWIYFVGPPAGMLLAAETYLAIRHYGGCAKFHHADDQRCIFCEHQFMKQFSG